MFNETFVSYIYWNRETKYPRNFFSNPEIKYPSAENALCFISDESCHKFQYYVHMITKNMADFGLY